MSHPSPGRQAPGRQAPARGAGGDEWPRILQHAPSAMAVVTGASHTLVYANAAFHALAAAARTAAGDAAAGEARPPLVSGAPVGATLPPSLAHPLLAVLDRVRASGQAERGTLAVTSAGRPGDPATGDAWPCTAWPVAPVATGGAEPLARPAAPRPAPAAACVLVAIDASAASALARVQQREVTERVLLSAFREEARADAADAARTVAEEANAARGRFLAATSHELRTPLQAIGGYAELLDMGLRGPVTEGQRDALGRIQQAMRHLLELTTALLDHVRLEAGQVEYALAPVPVAAALLEAVGLVAPQAGVRGVTVTVAPDDGRLAVRADAGKLRQIVVNLLANAVKFTTAGGAITVSSVPAGADAAAPPRVAIRVADTGCGIPADQLARVFDPYVQVGRRLPGSDAGVGLGLAISRALARGMDGDLTAESAVGVGSTFTVTLPAAVAP